MGINKMRKLAAAFGLKEPSFEANGYFKATFYRPGKSLEKVGEKFGVKFGEGSEKTSEKIIALIQKNNTISAQEIAKEIGLTQRAVEKQISALKNKGLLRRVGPDKGGHWEIVE
jgi:ATP-dependent DNA helicase RecG